MEKEKAGLIVNLIDKIAVLNVDLNTYRVGGNTKASDDTHMELIEAKEELFNLLTKSQ